MHHADQVCAPNIIGHARGKDQMLVVFNSLLS